jgi:UDP-N-acetylglucosamine:LPS N-acetylglucosamine transferase
MDLCYLGKKAIIVPTPEQAEQEYLGNLMEQKQFFKCILQHQLTHEIIRKDVEYTPSIKLDKFKLFEPVMDAWLDHL